MTDEVRAKFEKWAESHTYNIKRLSSFDDGYWEYATHDAWRAYLVGRRDGIEEAAQIAFNDSPVGENIAHKIRSLAEEGTKKS